ncbi:hypothetical protein QYE76_063242 [Lolium multiflorum]|uniref:Transposase (putative) gypsy type domain-containing protein n=1 Tax=Lolium multiflorum TaxID=4521 RepID=A0AAD8W950_LOLMU|nr:hypothetical protein QYE76_063242 [Lolium multiflorum]
MAVVDLGSAEWERSKISTQDINLLKKLGINKKPKALCFPSEESYPTPPMGYRVSFVDHLIRGLSAPIHPFLRGLLFVYGLQLHHLTPNSILHISIFITLCEAFLGVQPNWALWKRIFFCRRNGSPNVAYNIGGVVISVRPTVDYFDVKLPDSVQGWRKKWLYIQEENHGCAEDNIPPFDGAEKILRHRSWDAEATEEEKTSTEALMTRIHELQNTRGKELSVLFIPFLCSSGQHQKPFPPVAMSSSSSSASGLSLQSSPKNKEEDDPRSGANPISSDQEKKEGGAERAKASPSARLPPKKRSRMWADSEDDDDDEEEEDEEEEDDSSSSAGYPPTKRFRSWADSEDDDDDEEEEEGEGFPGSSADDLDDGDNEDSDSHRVGLVVAVH